MKFCHLLTLKSFQTFMTYFLLWNMKADFFEEYWEKNDMVTLMSIVWISTVLYCIYIIGLHSGCHNLFHKIILYY